MWKTWLFDLDGTLIDSIELIRSSYEHTIAEHLDREVDEEEFLSGLGRPLIWQFRRFTTDDGRVEAMVETYRTHNLELHDWMVSAYDGAREALTSLIERGCQLGIVTSKQTDTARRGLEVTGLLPDHFEVIIGSGDVTRHKPDPEPIQLALERLGAKPDDAIYIGDSPHDVRSGNAAGVATAAALWGPFSRDHLAEAEPDHWLEAPAAIPRIVRG